jgi:hypothetical protein
LGLGLAGNEAFVMGEGVRNGNIKEKQHTLWLVPSRQVRRSAVGWPLLSHPLLPYALKAPGPGGTLTT